MVLALLTVLTSPASAEPTSLAEVIAMRWKGYGEEPADFTTSGKVVTEERLSMTLGSDGTTITGTSYTRFTLDYQTYNASTSFTATYLPSEQAMSITLPAPTGDALPHGLYWCGTSGKMNFYNDSDHSGHFVIKGTLTSSCGGTQISVEYSTYGS